MVSNSQGKPFRRETLVEQPIPLPRIVEPLPAKKLLSNIHPLQLEENVGGGQGYYTTVSILEPVMRIERSGERLRNGGRSVYRIILNFKMQLGINKSFDVRYLYRSGERHDLLPKGDGVASDIQLTREEGNTTEVDAGISGSLATGAIPAFTVHAGHAKKLTYERKLRSWRKSLAYEIYPPLPTRNEGYTSLLGTLSIRPIVPESYFRVSSAHAKRCCCRRMRPWRCRQRRSRHQPYNRAAHWTGQTEAQLHLWTPEIYDNINYPLTITREVDADIIDNLLNQDTSYSVQELRRYLHFDFDVEVRLREIGWGFWGLFKSSSQPPEIRARNDSGKPLPPDRSKFCVSCCLERINWPRYETRDLQVEAEEQTARFGFVRQLQSTEEYQAQAQNAVIQATTGGRPLAPTVPGIVPGAVPGSSSGAVSSDARLYRRISFSPNRFRRTFRGSSAASENAPLIAVDQEKAREREHGRRRRRGSSSHRPPSVLTVSESSFDEIVVEEEEEFPRGRRRGDRGIDSRQSPGGARGEWSFVSKSRGG
ncbi:hypothetical protein OQA88_8556 [Cercophora sp. LCS_1]